MCEYTNNALLILIIYDYNNIKRDKNETMIKINTRGFIEDVT